MHTAVNVFRWIIRVTGLIQIVLGVFFWTRHALSLVPVHMLVGLILVLALWSLAGFALRGGMSVPGVFGAFALGALVLWLGITQAGMLVGRWHWVIQVLHLLLGLGAIRVGEQLSKRLLGAESSERTARAA